MNEYDFSKMVEEFQQEEKKEKVNREKVKSFHKLLDKIVQSS